MKRPIFNDFLQNVDETDMAQTYIRLARYSAAQDLYIDDLESKMLNNGEPTKGMNSDQIDGIEGAE